MYQSDQWRSREDVVYNRSKVNCTPVVTPVHPTPVTPGRSLSMHLVATAEVFGDSSCYRKHIGGRHTPLSHQFDVHGLKSTSFSLIA